jgi:hypothetical protein
VKLYADVGRRRFGQLLGDLLLVAWVAVCSGVGYVVYRVTDALGAPGRLVAEAGDGLAGDLRRMAEPAGEVPAVGDRLRVPLDSAAGAAARLAEAGRDQAEAVHRLAIVLAIVTVALPVLFALLLWLPRRIRFARNASAAQRYLDSDADLRLFALRAMANQPMHKLAKISDDPVTAWNDGDEETIGKLAALELRSRGLRMPPLSPSTN